MASQTLSTTDRIRELNAINEGIPHMLKAAGQAIAALSQRGLEDGDDMEMTNTGDSNDDVAARKQVFEENARAFYAHVQAITARFRRQAYALEEAAIIMPESAALSSNSQQLPDAGQGRRPEAERLTNGGLGNLDIGYLNSRGDKVGAEKEAELMSEAKELLQGVLGDT